MPFSEPLAGRVRDALAAKKGVEEKRMFGGLGFLLRGNMLVGVWKESLIVRLGLETDNDALLEPNVRAFDITGKPMKGWVMVDREGLQNDEQLQTWLDRAITFVGKLPAKLAKPAKTARPRKPKTLGRR